MLEDLLIFTRGGLVLWSLCQASHGGGAPAGRGAFPVVDALIRCCLLEERAAAAAGDGFTHGAYAVRWAFHNALGLVFAAVYHRVLLRVPYVDDLLAAVRKEFARVYSPTCRRASYPEFDDVFRQLHVEAEARAEAIKNRKQDPAGAVTEKQQEAVPGCGHSCNSNGADDGGDSAMGESDDDGDNASLAMDTHKGEKDPPQPSPAGSVVVKEKDVDNGGGNVTAFDVERLEELRRPNTRRNNRNKKDKKIKPVPPPNKSRFDVVRRIWSREEPSEIKLDYSVDNKKGDQATEHSPAAHQQGESKMDKADDDDAEDGGGPQNSTGGWFSSIINTIVGNTSTNKSDLQPALNALKDRLMAKNVAEEIAETLCASVAASLAGKRLASFTSVSATVRAAMEEALLRVLTPRRSVDVLREVHAVARDGDGERRPYVVVFVGVNGVGKSTSLAKVAYWLRGHGLGVTLAACDTFRAGAVEQLRTHARRLDIPLFEKGYERDPAAVAREAIREARRRGSDVVLVDTAGRMQDNEPLMRALAKLINVNSPDLVLFVGEALVGNDAVDQLAKFNQRLADLSAARPIDGIVLTKFDAVDDKVGAALSMVYTSGAPVMFVGCGQSYTDLKKLDVKFIVKTLLM